MDLFDLSICFVMVQWRFNRYTHAPEAHSIAWIYTNSIVTQSSIPWTVHSIAFRASWSFNTWAIATCGWQCGQILFTKWAGRQPWVWVWAVPTSFWKSWTSFLGCHVGHSTAQNLASRSLTARPSSWKPCRMVLWMSPWSSNGSMD